MSDIPSFAKLVPGFDFLQGLVKNAGSALPSMGQWVAPTLNPEELQKRIDELKTVQFWLEQNAKMLGTTIQALEVQRMTLSTLKTMNVQMTDLRDAMKVPPVAATTAAAQNFGADALLHAARNAMGNLGALGKTAAAPPGPAPARPAEPADAAPAPDPAGPGAAAAAAAAAAGAGAGVVDPMQWWGALTKQFTQLAAGALKDGAADAAKNFAGAMMKPVAEAAVAPSPKATPAPTAAAAKKPVARKAAAKRKPADAAAKTRAR
jgi:hypothetical protein